VKSRDFVFDESSCPDRHPAGSLDDDGQPDALHRLLRLSIGFDDEAEPGTTGTPAASIALAAAETLSPIRAHQLGLGPQSNASRTSVRLRRNSGIFGPETRTLDGRRSAAGQPRLH